jgi:hypothetical protein
MKTHGLNLAGRLASVLLLSCLVMAGHADQQPENEGRKRGARGGALIGLTMGALTGDAGLAVAGAAAGAVAGGVAGSWKDYEQDREDYRAETMAGAIATKGGGGDGEAPDGWHDIDAFIGQWSVTVWLLDPEGNRIDATAEAVSSLDTTQSVTFRFSNFQSEDFEEPVTGSSTMRFERDRGFELLNDFSVATEGNRYVGHFDNAAGKYEFFYAGSNQATYTGFKRTDYRLEMRMIGRDVIVWETFLSDGGTERKIQSYRLARKGN